MTGSNQAYSVGGIRYPRPFKIRRLGHFGFNLSDLDKGIDFYGRLLGFRMTEDLDLSKVPELSGQLAGLRDPRLIFMTHGTDHHAFLIAHRSLGAIFGDDAAAKDITLNQITWQVSTLEEVVQAEDYFRQRGLVDPRGRFGELAALEHADDDAGAALLFGSATLDGKLHGFPSFKAIIGLAAGMMSPGPQFDRFAAGGTLPSDGMMTSG